MYSCNIFQKILLEFKKELIGYSYKIFNINPKEKVFAIEDSLILYVGFLTHDEDSYGKCGTAFDYSQDYFLKIEELTSNEINFKFSPDSFMSQFGTNMFCRYFKFFSCSERWFDNKTNKCIERPKLIKRISEIIPELQIEKRNELWEGVLYYFVIFEVFNSEGKPGIGVFWTTSSPHSYALSKCRNWIKNGFNAGNFNAVGNGFEQAFRSWRGKHLRRKKIIEQNLTYFFIEKRVKDKNKLWKISYEIYNNSLNNEYWNIEKYNFTAPKNKWKSEEHLYNLTKKIFKKHKVIYQHRPFYLRSPKGGQMSYDVFIADLNIAIEYQGKQHFEPVEFFGGEDGYKKTTERDKLKKKISADNDIKLIYINYWEEITEKLIREKIKNFLKD